MRLCSAGIRPHRTRQPGCEHEHWDVAAQLGAPDRVITDALAREDLVDLVVMELSGGVCHGWVWGLWITDRGFMIHKPWLRSPLCIGQCLLQAENPWAPIAGS